MELSTKQLESVRFMSRTRLYTENEFSTILKRAAELQLSEGHDDAPGLSLAELEQVAHDVGMSPEFVRRAALELEEGEPDKGDRLLGGPTDIHLERIVDGELSGKKWEEALGALKHSFGTDGKEMLEGPTREWTHRDQMGGRVRVSMTPSGRQTRLRVSYGMTEWLWLQVIMVCIGIGPVAVQYALLDLGAIVETGIALLIMMAFYMVGWLAFRVFSSRQDRKLHRVLNWLEDIVAEPDAIHMDQRGEIAVVDAEEGRLDAPMLSDGTSTKDASSIPHRKRRAE